MNSKQDATIKHKAATEVTVAPLAERSPLEEFVYKHWAKALVLFLAASIAIVLLQRQEEEAAAINDRSWSTLGPAIEFAELPGVESDPDRLMTVAAGLEGTLAGPWAEALIAPALAKQGDYSEAVEVAQAFRQAHPNHELLRLEVADSEGGYRDPLSILEARIAAFEAFRAANPTLFANPEPPSDAPRVALETSLGTIELTLYSDLAPNHAQNFVDRVEQGLYDNNKFHRVIADFMIQSGDPNSIEGEPTTWGSGGGDETQPQEFSELAHFPGFLSMAKRPGEVESSLAQFFITLGAPHHLDGQHTVFGKVTGGMDVVEAIGSGAIAEGTGDRPAEPVSILSAKVL
jgi:cyclophilin family peptidyl-prolyl cis-trans isomerase